MAEWTIASIFGRDTAEPLARGFQKKEGTPGDSLWQMHVSRLRRTEKLLSEEFWNGPTVGQGHGATVGHFIGILTIIIS